MSVPATPIWERRGGRNHGPDSGDQRLSGISPGGRLKSFRRLKRVNHLGDQRMTDDIGPAEANDRDLFDVAELGHHVFKP